MSLKLCLSGKLRILAFFEAEFEKKKKNLKNMKPKNTQTHTKRKKSTERARVQPSTPELLRTLHSIQTLPSKHRHPALSGHTCHHGNTRAITKDTGLSSFARTF